MAIDLSDIDKDKLLEFVTQAKNHNDSCEIILELHGRSLRARVSPEKWNKTTPDRMSEELFAQCLCIDVGNQRFTTAWLDIDQENVVNLLIDDLQKSISQVL
ncbi:hypothetical protein [Photobacterium rosenbergii]|uniref:DUF3630 domain-containing protein n=1 Tax=Photobacterium rosenbergii TaxID=294936 RepID=A0ABU3ZFB8_9GAMM|nr:hypothetical protein [Photobacterium rosenbergii]MDV5168802.1 hypothetical protein [Photobacterium rosenbergii]MDV5168818.1 hypothetical protein [Photobacterium rosenbergii]